MRNVRAILTYYKRIEQYLPENIKEVIKDKVFKPYSSIKAEKIDL